MSRHRCSFPTKTRWNYWKITLRLRKGEKGRQATSKCYGPIQRAGRSLRISRSSRKDEIGVRRTKGITAMPEKVIKGTLSCNSACAAAPLYMVQRKSACQPFGLIGLSAHREFATALGSNLTVFKFPAIWLVQVRYIILPISSHPTCFS